MSVHDSYVNKNLKLSQYHYLIFHEDWSNFVGFVSVFKKPGTDLFIIDVNKHLIKDTFSKD